MAFRDSTLLPGGKRPAPLPQAKACLDHIEQAISAYPADAEERESIRLLRLDAEKIAKELAEEEEKRRRGV